MRMPLSRPLRTLLLVLVLHSAVQEAAEAHTKGITLSRYGLVDISWTGNVALAAYSDYYNGFNATKLGTRHFTGLNFTSFDVSFTQEVYQFPAKFGLFTAWGPTGVGIEEGFLLFHKLPYWLQLKTGIFRVNFTKLNQYHDHEWAFADPPLITTLLLGVDGVHTPGIELNWQPDTPVFTEGSLSLMRGAVGGFGRTFPGNVDIVSGDEDFRDFSVWSRGTTFLDVNEDTNVEFGVSGAAGRNKPLGVTPDLANPLGIVAGNGDMTYMGGLDMTWTYKPAPFSPYIRWTSEYLMAARTNPVVLNVDRGKQQDGKPLEEQLTRTLASSDVVGGMYSELNYRFHYNWDASARMDMVGLPVGAEDPQTRFTSSLRYFMNPVSRLGLQHSYNLGSGTDRPYHTAMLQLNVGGGTVTPGIGKFYTLF